MATSGIDEDEIDMQRVYRLSDVDREPLEMLMPISGYEDMPLVTLEMAIQPLLSISPFIQSYAHTAKKRCKNPPADGLTIDESASIMLYSMDWSPHDQCVYVVLNNTLRSTDRGQLKPWFLYLKLFLTALSRLPPIHRHVYRGVKLDLSEKYEVNQTIVWWGFSSCTTSINVLQSELFLGKTGTRTMFSIDCYNGKDIRKHSYFPKEDEVLLIAASQFQVIGHFDAGNGLHTIQLTETEPTHPLLHPIINPNNSSSNTASISTNPFQPQLTNDHSTTMIHNMQQFNLNQDIGTHQESKLIESSFNLQVNNNQVDQSSTTNKPSISTKQTSKSEESQFAPINSYKPLICRGRACAKCGKCRDWYYTGDAASLCWVQNWETWDDDDWNLWYSNSIWERFKRREGATCIRRRLYSLSRSLLYCLCDDNVRR